MRASEGAGEAGEGEGGGWFKLEAFFYFFCKFAKGGWVGDEMNGCAWCFGDGVMVLHNMS